MTNHIQTIGTLKMRIDLAEKVSGPNARLVNEGKRMFLVEMDNETIQSEYKAFYEALDAAYEGDYAGIEKLTPVYNAFIGF